MRPYAACAPGRTRPGDGRLNKVGSTWLEQKDPNLEDPVAARILHLGIPGSVLRNVDCLLISTLQNPFRCEKDPATADASILCLNNYSYLSTLHSEPFSAFRNYS